MNWRPVNQLPSGAMVYVRTRGSNPMPTSQKPQPPPNPPRCTYNPGPAPPGYHRCERCGELSYWPASREVS